MRSDAPSPPGVPSDLPRLAAAFAVTLLWGVVYLAYGNPGVVDEPGHLGVMHHLTAHRPGLPDNLPNLPGYHALVILLAGGAPSLFFARAVTLGLAFAGLAWFAAAWRHLHRAPAGGATLLLALLPLLLPFTAMVYTDVPALTFLLGAFWAHCRGHRASAALLLALSCLMRQTSLIWAAYLLCVELADALWPRTGRPPRTAHDLAAAADHFVDRNRWLLLFLATATAAVLYAGRLTVGTTHGNQFQANPAMFHFAGLLLALLALPTWFARSGPALRTLRAAVAARPRRWLPVAAFGLGLALAAAWLYRNGHAWNRPLLWPEEPCAFVLLRNVPLVALEHSGLLRLLSGLLLVGQVAALVALTAGQPRRRELLLLLPFTGLLMLSNGLVDPRYFIPPLALALLYYRPTEAGLHRQIRWFALLCAVLAPFVLPRLALW